MVVRRQTFFFLLLLGLLSFSPFTSGVSSCSTACAKGELCISGSCTNVCDDATPIGQCSSRKPLFCNQQGQLVNNLASCGCPSTKPIPLPSGYCGVRMNETAYGEKAFSLGKADQLKLVPSTFPNLALNKPVQTGGFRCPLGSASMTDGEAPLYRWGEVNYYESFCYLPNNITGAYIQIDLGRVQQFDKAVLLLGYPYIVDYSILYSVDGSSWKTATADHPAIDTENAVHSMTWYFGQYLDNDLGMMKLYSRPGTSGTWFYEVFFNQQKYQSVFTPVTFQPVSGRYVRFVPKNWFERAALYDIQLFNTDAQLQNTLHWDQTVGRSVYSSESSYESPILFANVSRADLRYGTIRWDSGVQQNGEKRNVKNWGPDILAAKNPPYVIFDTGYGNDLGDRMFGYEGSPRAGLVPLVLPSFVGTTTSISDGIGKTSLLLDGIDDYAWATGDPILRLTQNFSFSVWVKPTNGGPVFMRGTANDERVLDYALFATTTGSTGTLKLFLRQQWYETPSLPLDTQWHHIGVTYVENGPLIFYLDGVEVHRVAAVTGHYARPTFNAPYSLHAWGHQVFNSEFKLGIYGRGRWSGNEYPGRLQFKGNIDEMMIYTQPLTQTQIMQLSTLQRAQLQATGAVTLPDTLTRSLLAYWDFATPLSSDSYKAFQYLQNTELEQNWIGTKISNRVIPFYDQTRSGSYPEAGQTTVAYATRCLFDDKWAGQPTTVGGVPNQPCAYHPAETSFPATSYIGNWSLALDGSSFKAGLYAYFGANTSADGAKGRGLMLDGIDAYLAYPGRFVDTDNTYAGHLNIKQDDYSFSFWLKEPKYVWGRILSKGDVNSINEPAYDILVNPGNRGISLRIRDASKTEHVANLYYPSATEWAHIAFTVRRSTGELIGYVNGVEQERKSVPLATGSIENVMPFVIGGQSVAWLDSPQIRTGSRYDLYGGKLDEVRLFKRVLTVNEVQQLAQERDSSTRIPLLPQEVGHWSFEEDSYNMFPNPITQAFDLDFFSVPVSGRIDRLILNEVIDRVTRVALRKEGAGGGWVGDWKKTPTGEANTTTVFDLDTPLQAGTYDVRFYVPIASDPHARSPLIWELGFMETAPISTTPFTGTYTTGLQLRTALSSAELEGAPWKGPDGTNTSYYTSGQQINQLHNQQQYYQYRIITSISNIGYTPIIDNISISYAGRINRPPVARLTNPGKIIQLEEKVFNASHSKDDDGIVSYFFDFGDGTTVTETSPYARHTYSLPGDYLITLRVTDAQGAQDENYFSFTVEPFDCLTPDTYGSSDPALVNLGGTQMQLYALQAVQEYAERHNLPDIRYVDTAEEYMDAALEYLDAHMSYLVPRAQCFQTHGGLPRLPVSFERIVGTTPSCGCPEGAQFCGNCMDYSIAFVSLVRAMGVHSSCVYSATTESRLPFQTTDATLHAYNVILYHGKYRIIEPQGSSLTSKFSVRSLDWENGEVPFYLTGLIFNDHVGNYIQLNDPITSRQGTLGMRISNYPGTNGQSDPARKCQLNYRNLSRVQDRLTLAQDFVRIISIYTYNVSDTKQEQITKNFQLLLKRNPTVSEVGAITDTQLYDFARYFALPGVESEFKTGFARHAFGSSTKTADDFMSVSETEYIVKLYNYILGYSLTDTSTPARLEYTKLYHQLTSHAFYRSYYAGYDPLGVFDEACP